jgi:hypothetical protein
MEALTELEGVSESQVEEVIHSYARLGQQTESTVIQCLGRGDPEVEEELERSAENLRQALNAPVGTPLEKLLIDRIVCSWLQVNNAQRYCSGVEDLTRQGVDRSGVILRLEETLQKRLSASQRRLLEAVKTLTQVRKLLGLPSG